MNDATTITPNNLHNVCFLMQSCFSTGLVLFIICKIWWKKYAFGRFSYQILILLSVTCSCTESIGIVLGLVERDAFLAIGVNILAAYYLYDYWGDAIKPKEKIIENNDS